MLTKSRKKRHTDKQRYAIQRADILVKKRLEYKLNPLAKARYNTNPSPMKAAARARYNTNPSPMKAAAKARYNTNSSPMKAAAKARYIANPSPKKAAAKARYVANPSPKKASAKARYVANPSPKKASAKARYVANPSPKKASAKARYVANPSPKKASAKARYVANPSPKKSSAKARYVANPSPKKASAKARYVANPSPKKSSAKARYVANPSPKKSSAKARYSANPSPKKASAKARYVANPSPKKSSARARYSANPSPKKASAKARYLANPSPKKASAKARYLANPSRKKALARKISRTSYKENPLLKIAASKLYYSKKRLQKKKYFKRYYKRNKKSLCFLRRAKYSLSEPKVHVISMYIKQLKLKVLGSPQLRSELCKCFTKVHGTIAERMSRTTLANACCRIAAERLVHCALRVRKGNVGHFLKSIRRLNAMSFPSRNLGVSYHTAGSEPYFYDTAYRPVEHKEPIPVDEHGRCVLAKEVHPQKAKMQVSGSLKYWECTAECKVPTADEIDSIVTTKLLFQKPIEEIRQGLDSIDEGCPHLHFSRPVHPGLKPVDMSDGDYSDGEASDGDACDCDFDIASLSVDLMGHPLPCSDGNCRSKLFAIRSVSVHYPLVRLFLRYIYHARNSHCCVSNIDVALVAGDFDRLKSLCGISNSTYIFKDDLDVKTSHTDNSVPGLPGLEPRLQVRHAELISALEKDINDDPEFACCSCERLFQRKNVTSMKRCDTKFTSDVWELLKAYILSKNGDVDLESFYICSYCRPFLNGGQMPCRCVLNGLETEALPKELCGLDALSKQLIQRAKSFQTIVRLGTYTGRVPIYNSLKACKGTMFFLPLPMKKTLDTLAKVSSGHMQSSLPSPELYIMINGKPSKQKVVWRSIVNVDAVKKAVQKLKEINWLYKEVDELSVDDVTKQVIETVNSTSSTMLVKASKDDVSQFQCYSIRTLNEKLSTVSDIEQYKLLDVKEGPIDSRQKFLDVMCFPVLFPSGRFGECHPRKVKISSSEYAKSRLLNKDSRYRKDPQYVFFLLWQREMRELAAGVYNLMKGTRNACMPVQVFLDKVSKSDQGVEANLSTIFQSVRGSKQYWFLRSSELRCMLREWGTPTLFLTFSCAEYNSPEIACYLHKVNDVPDSYPIGKLCCEDPISVSRKFSQKFHAFFNTVILKGHVLGSVTHYFYKKEYQARGAPHYHCVVWIQDAPTVGKNPPHEVLTWIKERITCRIPDETTNPELHKLVSKYQRHKCSNYCKRRKKCGGAFITKCRFAYPRQASESGQINDVDDALKTKTKIYILPRAENETRINDYNPLLLLLWKANMDIQFIAEQSLALAHYVTGYITKAERSNMQELWQEVASEKSVYSKLWSFGVRSLRSRECGLYEASDLLLGEHLCGKSDNVKWIDAAFPNKRKRRIKGYQQLQELKEKDPGSEDIFENNLIDTCYPQRPGELEDVCLYDFVRDYVKDGMDEFGQEVYKKRSKPLLPNHKMFDPNKESQKQDYYYSLLLLFVPFRSEDELVNEGETAEEAFLRVSKSNAGVHIHHEKLQQVLQANIKVKAINDARQEEDKGDCDEYPELGPCVVGEVKSAVNDLHDLQHRPDARITLEDRTAMLNADQSRIFHHVSDHLLHQQRHETGLCKCSDFKPLHMYLSGVGGTGKSFLIEAIRDKADAIWGLELTCAVAAPTGLAAFNVGGVTLHRLFQLPIEHEGKPAEYWPLPKETQKFLRNTFRDLKLVIVDEVSMISCLNLAFMHLRMGELFGTDEWFGSINTIFVGDLLQLPPVSGGLVFDQLNSKAILSKLGSMTAVNIWKETVTYDELTINERQKDAKFCALLDEVRCGCVSDETIATLKDRVMSVAVVDKFKELQSSGQSPVCLFPKRSPCEDFNLSMLNSLNSKVVEIACTDEVDETNSSRKWNKKAAEQLEKLNMDSNLTAGLEAVLRIAVGARVMLRRNIDTEAGLVNGSIGTVVSIKASRITVQFDNGQGECEIEKAKSKFIVMKHYYVYREQFPLILAYAITIHKCQGLSLQSAIMDLSSSVFCPGMAYVALSRVRTLSGVHLTAFEAESIAVNCKSLQEINRLRGLFRPDLPAYVIPSTSKKRKLTGVWEISEPKKQKTVQGTKRQVFRKRPRCKTEDDDVQIVEKKARACEGDVVCQQEVGSGFRFFPISSHWQRQKCQLLGLQYHRANRFGSGGPECVLTKPNMRTVRHIVGDGNCLFRAFSYVVTGSEDDHMPVRVAIINHMISIAHLLLGAHVMHNSIQEYIETTGMDQNSSWGTDIEILTFAHLLFANVYTFSSSLNRWILFSPHHVDTSLPLNTAHQSVYLLHKTDPEHYEVVSSIK